MASIASSRPGTKVPGYFCALAVVCAAVASISAQRKPAPAARPAARTELAVPFRAGETLSYDVSWSSYLTAGNATVTVREKKPSFNSVAYYVVAEGRPTPLLSRLYTLYYKADTLIDVYTLLPQRGSVYSEEGRRRRMKITRFDHPARKAQFEMQTTTTMKKDLSLPPYAQDALSAIFALRAIPLKAGDKMTMPVVDSGHLYKVQMTVVGRETVTSGIGAVAAWKVAPVILGDKGRPEGKGYAMWITDDARRLPVRLQADLAVGSFRLTLREVR